jgi:hypothetical protein
VIGVTGFRDDWAQASMRRNTMRRTLETALEVSFTAAIRLLPAGRFYNRHFGRHLLAFFHASDDD